MGCFGAACKRPKAFYVGSDRRHWSGRCLTRISLLKTPRNCSFSALFYGLVTMAVAVGCASIPGRRAAINSVTVHGAHKVSASDVEDKLATMPSSKLLGLFRGVVYDYELLDGTDGIADLLGGS